MSIRWKILLLCAFIAAMPVFFLMRFTLNTFDQFTRRTLEDTMIDYASVVAEEYRQAASDGTTTALADRLGRYGAEFQCRLRLLDTRGVTLADSDPAAAPGMNLAQRPEVLRALAGRYGSWSSLRDGGRNMYYDIALPVQISNRVVAVAHVTRHTRSIVSALKSIETRFRITLAAALLLAVFLAALLAHTITRRLRLLTHGAQAFARGDQPLLDPPRGEDEIGRLGLAVAQMAEEIGRKNVYNRDFLAATTHELKSPLTAIRGAVDVLEQGAADQPEPRKKFLGNIRFEADRLIRMVDDLSGLTRLEAEELRGLKEKTDYAACLRDILERLRPTFPEPHAELRVSIPDGAIPALVVSGRIEQVVSNLLENAFRYTPAAGQVDVTVTRGGNRDIITQVRDSGRGIATADLPRVFDRFFTTEPKAQKQRQGTGLGLAIAKGIVENHGGRMWAESELGKGSSFFFSLPSAES